MATVLLKYVCNKEETNSVLTCKRFSYQVNTDKVRSIV